MQQSYEEMLEVLKAAAEGKTIQCRSDPRDLWKDLEAHEASWDFSYYEYRAKPEPLTLYVNVYYKDADSDDPRWSSTAYSDRATAKAAADPTAFAVALPLTVPEEE